MLDEDDPTLNNPALDLEDSDVDDEWTPMKEKVGRYLNKEKVGRYLDRCRFFFITKTTDKLNRIRILSM